MSYIYERGPIGTCPAGDLHIIEKEKFGVFKRRYLPERDRATDISSELVQPQFGFRRIKRTPSVERLIAKEFIGSSVEIFSAALGRCRDQDAGITTMLGAEVAVLNFELADCIQAHLCKLPVIRPHIGIDCAIEVDIVGSISQPIDIKPLSRIEGEVEIG